MAIVIAPPASADEERRRDRAATALVVVVLMVVYALTLLPGVGGSGDAVKFQFLAREPGTPHATGYPAYLLLNLMFNRLVPVGSPALAANLLSAVLAAAACASVFAALRTLDIARPVALASAVGLGFTATLWLYATIAEVYSLHLLFCSLILFFLLRWERRRRTGDLYAAFAVLALAVGNHMTVVCWVPAIILFIAVVDRSTLTRPRFLIVAASLVTLGLLQYSYLIWCTFDPGVRYLETTAGDLRELVTVLLGGRHQSNLLQQSFGELLAKRIPWIARSLLAELVVFAPFAVAGLLRRLAARDCLLLGAAAGNLAFIGIYTVGDLDAYLPPIVVIAVCYAAVGLQRLLSIPAGERRRAAWAVLLLPLCLFLMNWREADRRGSRGPRKMRRIMAQAPDPALILGMPYRLTMELNYAMLVDREGGGRQLLRVPLQAPFASFGFEEFRRYLCDGFPLRLPPRGRLVPAGLPIVLAGATPRQLDALRAKGYELVDAGRDLVRLTLPSCEQSPLPVAAVVHELEARRDLGRAITALIDPAFDPMSTSIVIGRRGERFDRPPVPAEVTLHEWLDDRALLVVDSAGPGWLVVFDFMPTLWRAWVDGRPAASRPLNVIHRGVPIPAGRHEVLLADTSHDFSMWRWLTGAHPPLETVARDDRSVLHRGR
jgi:hypothetical protein